MLRLTPSQFAARIAATMFAGLPGSRYKAVLAGAALMIAALVGGTFVARTSAAPTCHLAGTWNQTTKDVGSTSWSIQANGIAEESQSPGAKASGTATLSNGELTINWTTPTHYAGTYRWTLQSNCSGSGELTFTEVAPGDDRKGKSYPSQVTGPAPTEPPSGCGSRRGVAHAAAINEVRVVAVQPSVQAHKAGTPEACWIELKRDAVLQQGDEISCDPDGAVTLQFADNSTVVIRHTTQLKIASFFTEGGVVKTEILLKMGEVAAQVHKSEATKSDFRIADPNLEEGGVRGTTFSAFYDPGTRASLWSVTEGTVAVKNHQGVTRLVTAGHEALVSRSGRFTVARLGKAGARGGLNSRDALAKVLRIVARGNGPCHATTPRTNAFAVKPARNGWTIRVKLRGGLRGTSSWRVRAKRAKPSNALAKKITRRCG